MVRQKLSQFLLYRWRYLLAYTVFSVALGTLLVVAGFYLPGGLSQSEVNSALISEGLSPTGLFELQPDELIYLPYHLLQAASIAVFGFTPIAIKLPSILLGFISALGILYLLNLWYRRNVAIVTAVVAVTTNQFMLASQAGQPGIAYVALTTFILIAASMVARRTSYATVFWVVTGFILAAISLYMPLSAYVLLALLATSFIHPHARHIIRHQASKPVIGIGVFLFLLLISPLVYGVIQQPDVLRTLAGIPDSLAHVGPNAAELSRHYGQVYAPTSGEVLIPVYGLGILLLLALGVYRLVSAKYTTKSYILSFWLLLLVPLVFLNPDFVSITFLPVVLLLALGIEYLIWSWYRLFPRNPYARVFGLLPLAVLIGGLVASSIDRYGYGFHYDESVYKNYTFDLNVLTRELRAIEDDTPVVLVVSKRNVAFYDAFARHQNYVSSMLVTATPQPPSSKLLIVERTVRDESTIPSGILVAGMAEDADRFYLYKSDSR